MVEVGSWKHDHEKRLEQNPVQQALPRQDDATMSGSGADGATTTPSSFSSTPTPAFFDVAALRFLWVKDSPYYPEVLLKDWLLSRTNSINKSDSAIVTETASNENTKSSDCNRDSQYRDPHLLSCEDESSQEQQRLLLTMDYATLVRLCAGLLRQLMAHEQGMRHRQHEYLRQDTATIVVVAIPQGPLLPITLLLVHVWNVQQSNENDNINRSIIWIPLNPQQGDVVEIFLERHQPLLILVAGECDARQMESYLLRRQRRREDSTPGCQQLQQRTDNHCHSYYNIVNVCDLLSELSPHASQDLSESLHYPPSTNLKNYDVATPCTDSSTCCSMALVQWIAQASGCLPLTKVRASTATDSTPHGGNSTSGSNDSKIQEADWISHIVFTSGTSTGTPKGCICSFRSLEAYLAAKNRIHEISGHITTSAIQESATVTQKSVVYLASNIAFDPCCSDCLATLRAGATLALPPYDAALQPITHVLCTPSQWRLQQILPQREWSAGDDEDDTVQAIVVALGGEPIPPHFLNQEQQPPLLPKQHVRVLATYGVTEACVYQTAGWVQLEGASSNKKKTEGYVGKPFPGMGVEIWDVAETTSGLVRKNFADGREGEVVLYGSQVNSFSGYYQQPELTAKRFIYDESLDRYYYRTGDRGFVQNGDLYVFGRIAGDTMVKYKGVRVELHDIERALLSLNGLIEDAIVVPQWTANSSVTSVSDVYAYIVLHPTGWSDLWKDDAKTKQESIRDSGGLLVTSLPLLMLLQKCCKVHTRVVPSAFVIIDEVPTTANGKRNQRGLKPFEMATPMALDNENAIHLASYGHSGPFLAEELRTRLNLLPSQESLLTTQSSYLMLGGDSLTATLIVRSLYAIHANLRDSRFLGGSFGMLQGIFAPQHFLRSSTLGDYVDWLDSNDAFTNCKHQADAKMSIVKRTHPESSEEELLFDSLLRCCSCNYFSVALHLLHFVSPNYGQTTGARLANTPRLERKHRFRSNPLHLACLHGHPRLVRLLLENGAKFNTPNASGLFPLHLAASGANKVGLEPPSAEQDARLECIKLLLSAGAPRTAADANRQSILHSAARSGNTQIVTFLAVDWMQHARKMGFEWRDAWMRTPVHWAVLNGHVATLKALLEAGCDPMPPRVPQTKSSTSLVYETPIEICHRVHGAESVLGQSIEKYLLDFRIDSCPI